MGDQAKLQCVRGDFHDGMLGDQLRKLVPAFQPALRNCVRVSLSAFAVIPSRDNYAANRVLLVVVVVGRIRHGVGWASDVAGSVAYA